MNFHAGLTHTIALVSSGNAGGIVGLTSQVNKHAIGSERAGGGRRDGVAPRYI